MIIDNNQSQPVDLPSEIDGKPRKEKFVTFDNLIFIDFDDQCNTERERDCNTPKIFL